MIDPCPKCNKDMALVGKVHNCNPPRVKPAAKPKRKKKARRAKP